jgi:uncharacterized protein YerC
MNRLNKISKLLYECSSKEEISLILDLFITNSEKTNIKKRLKIATLLLKNNNYKLIERKTKSSSATIAKVNKKLDYIPDNLLDIIRSIDE